MTKGSIDPEEPTFLVPVLLYIGPYSSFSSLLIYRVLVDPYQIDRIGRYSTSPVRFFLDPGRPSTRLLVYTGTTVISGISRVVITEPDGPCRPTLVKIYSKNSEKFNFYVYVFFNLSDLLRISLFTFREDVVGV